MVSRAPEDDELEVSVFGPGYGETVVVHLGLGDWLIVDSCKKKPNSPAAINYLKQIGINPGSAVKLVVASHWHDDHVGGLASVLDECQNAKFSCSVSLRSPEFLTFVRANGSHSIDRGLQEFAKILNILQQRGATTLQWASENTRLWQRTSGAVTGEVFSLSPSSAAHTLSLREISQLLPQNGQQKTQIIATRPNQAAVVLWLTLGDHSIILGSDLEEENEDSGRGWSVIVDSTTKPTGMAQIFKIPHHGSENAHYQRVWSDMLMKKPLAVLTPFVNGGVSLPKSSDVRRICRITPNAFSTTSVLSPQRKKRHGALDRTIKEVTRSIKTIPNVPGHVRMRKKVSSKESWAVELLDGAVKLSEAIESQSN